MLTGGGFDYVSERGTPSTAVLYEFTRDLFPSKREVPGLHWAKLPMSSAGLRHARRGGSKWRPLISSPSGGFITRTNQRRFFGIILRQRWRRSNIVGTQSLHLMCRMPAFFCGQLVLAMSRNRRAESNAQLFGRSWQNRRRENSKRARLILP